MSATILDRPTTPTAAPLHSIARRLEQCGVTGSRSGDLYAEGALWYDAMVRDDATEIAQLLRAARGVTSPIVDLAAGSGRLTIPLLAAGHHVIAVDDSAQMLALLHGRLEDRPELAARLTTVQADMVDVDFGSRVDLAICGATSVSVLDRAQRCSMLANVATQLTATGRFLFSTLDVDVAEHEGAEVEHTRLIGDGDACALFTILERIDAAGARRSVTVVHQPMVAGGEVTMFSATSQIVGFDDLIEDATHAGLHPASIEDLAVVTTPGRRVRLVTCVRADQATLGHDEAGSIR